MRKLLTGLLVVLVLAGIAWLVGPRTPVDTTIHIDEAAIAADPQAYVERAESQVPGIRDGLQKEIVWAYPASRAKTPLAIVYIHGFSASRGEIAPVPGKVAAALGANLFYTRLAGHGRSGAAMATATVNDWLNDMAEALAIGRAIGEKVVVIATSTGGGLATWAAARPELARNLAGLVLISPNLRLKDPKAFLLTQPWGGQIAEMVVGKERGFEPQNDLHAKYWTYRYPTKALLPMGALVKLASQTPMHKISVPALFIYSPDDQVVDESETAAAARRWGAPVETVEVLDADDPYDHVIAGDAISPNKTDELTARMIDWIGKLPR